MMGFAKGLPLADVGDVHARADDLMKVRVHCLQGIADNFKAAAGLGVGVVGSKGVAVVADRGSTGEVDEVACAKGAAVANFSLPFGVGEITLYVHGVMRDAMLLALASKLLPPLRTLALKHLL